MSPFTAGIADYEFVEELGAGNYGYFWRARTPARLDVDAPFVTVKVLHHRSQEQGYARMANELRVYRAAGSDHLVPIYDAGHESGTIFYAARYSEVGSLDAASARLDRAARLRAVASVARGVHDLHEVGVAHRDIKPSNMLLFDDGAKLGDLGLAQILNPGQSATGMGPVGSLAHLSPEMIRGEDAGRASDVFALGVSLHSILCGEPVFPDLEGRDLREALRFMLRPTPTVSAGLSEAEAAAVSTCVAQEPADRYPTAAALADELDRLAAAPARDAAGGGAAPPTAPTTPTPPAEVEA